MRKNNNTYISVVIPCYNVERFLHTALDSILNQTYPYFEVICIDDYSSDKTLEILKFYSEKDERIKVFANKENLGVTATRNLLINYSQYEYVLFMDSDDISDIQRIQKLVEEKDKYNADIVSSNYTFIDENGNPLKTNGLDLLKTKLGIKFVTFFNSPIPHAPSLVRKKLLTDNNYNENYKAAEDYKLFSDLICNEELNVRILDESLYLYRINQMGMSMSNNHSQIESHIRIATEFICKEFGKCDNYDFWRLSKFDISLEVLSRSHIISSLKQINQIRVLYLNKYSLSKEEREEVNRYTAQYYIFSYYSLLKQAFKNKKIIKALSCISISFINNINILINVKNIKWMIKKI